MPISSHSPESGKMMLNIFFGNHWDVKIFTWMLKSIYLDVKRYSPGYQKIFTWILKDIHLDIKRKIFNRNVARRFEHPMTQPGHLDDVNGN